MLSDIFPTGYHGAVLAGVVPGDTVAVFGAGPVGLLAAHSSYLRGAAGLPRAQPGRGARRVREVRQAGRRLHQGAAAPGRVMPGDGQGRTATAGDGQGRTATAGDGQLRPEQLTRLVLRPQASSLPLGFFAFGMGTILLTAMELHWTALAAFCLYGASR